MLRRYQTAVGWISLWFNYLAAVCLFITMGLVVTNIVLRAVFNSPIKITYDFVGFFTAIAIGLSLAYCGLKDGHISISIIMQRFPHRWQRAIDIIIVTISAVLLFVVAGYVAQYAYTMSVRGEVGLSSGMPHAPFIYIIAAGVALLGLVVLGQLFRLVVNGGVRE